MLILSSFSSDFAIYDDVVSSFRTRLSQASQVPLDFHVVFAPAGTTTDGSGYTAIEVGKDNKVYVGAARYIRED